MALSSLSTVVAVGCGVFAEYYEAPGINMKNTNLSIIKEAYVLPDGDQYLLYAPLIHVILKVNKSLLLLLNKINDGEDIPQDINTLDALEQLQDIGILNGTDQYPINQRSHEDYLPTSVTFLPTSDCNLGCIYCYANSGSSSKYLSVNVAKKAVDVICDNAKLRNIPSIQIGFLGGGEPFLAWDLVTELYSYTKMKAENLGLSTFFTGVTNGMLSNTQTNWICDNFQYLNVSLDGTKEIQDQHRPTKNMASSFNTIINTISLLNQNKFDFSIRSTISKLSVNKMEEITSFFVNEIGVKKIHFEPLFACGRCKTDSDLVPDPWLFADNFKKCISIVNGTKTELFCSSARLDTISSTYCGALVENFYITPDGYVTACTEVSSINDELAEIFFIGKYDDNTDSFSIWKDKREALLSRTVNSMKNCQKCIAKWHCSGGCPAKADNGNVFENVDSAGCIIARDLTEYHLKVLARGESDSFSRITARII